MHHPADEVGDGGQLGGRAQAGDGDGPGVAEARHRGEGHGGGEQDGENDPEGGVDRQQHALTVGRRQGRVRGGDSTGVP